jgi:hypothetical protein
MYSGPDIGQWADEPTRGHHRLQKSRPEPKLCRGPRRPRSGAEHRGRIADGLPRQAAGRAGSQPVGRGRRAVARRAIQVATLDLEPGPGPAAEIGGGLVLRDEPLVASPLDFLPRVEAVGGQAARREE